MAQTETSLPHSRPNDFPNRLLPIWMLRALMLVQLERNMRLPLPAAKHFLVQLVLRRGVAARPSHHFSSLLDGRVRLRPAFLIVFTIQRGADGAWHRGTFAIVPVGGSGRGTPCLHNLRINHTTKTITITVPTIPSPSILFLLGKQGADA